MNALLIETGALDLASGDTRAYVVASTCRYAFPLAYPETVRIGLALASIGTSSITWKLGAFRDGVAAPAAEGGLVHVCIDPDTQRPVPVPQNWRSRLETFTTDDPAILERAEWT